MGKSKTDDRRHTPTKKNTYFEKYDLYSDANPKDTIPIRYDTLDHLKETIRKLERLYKTNKYPHKRIVQVANVLHQRLRVIYDNYGKGKNRKNLADKYFTFLTKQRTPLQNETDRKKLKFI